MTFKDLTERLNDEVIREAGRRWLPKDRVNLFTEEVDGKTVTFYLESDVFEGTNIKEVQVQLKADYDGKIYTGSQQPDRDYFVGIGGSTLSGFDVLVSDQEVSEEVIKSNIENLIRSLSGDIEEQSEDKGREKSVEVPLEEGVEITIKKATRRKE